MTMPEPGVYEPLKVHIASSEVELSQPSPARPEKRRRRGIITRTFQLTSNDPIQEILPQSDARCEAWITSMTNACLIATSQSDAKAAGNAAATIPTNIVPVPLNCTDAVWATSATLPTSISIVSVYEQRE